MAAIPDSPKQSGFVNPFRDVDYGALWRKARGDSSADVIKKWDNVQPTLFGHASGTDATLPGGSKSPIGRSEVQTIIADARDYPEIASSTSLISNDPPTPTPDPVAQRLAAAEAQADPLRKALSAVDVELRNNLASNRGEYDNILSDYRAQDASDRQEYERQVGQNETQFTTNRHNQLLSGARLNNSLRNILASMGALAGTGSQLAGDTATRITNRAIGEAGENFSDNAATLDRTWSNAEREQERRRKQAETELERRNLATERSALEGRQGILNSLANLFGSDTQQGQQYLSQAGELYGQIANTSRPVIADYAAANATYSPAELNSYLAGIGNNPAEVSRTAPGASTVPLNSPLFGRDRRRERELV